MTIYEMKKNAAKIFEKEFGIKPAIRSIIPLESGEAEKHWYLMFALGSVEWQLYVDYSRDSYDLERYKR